MTKRKKNDQKKEEWQVEWPFKFLLQNSKFKDSDFKVAILSLKS